VSFKFAIKGKLFLFIFSDILLLKKIGILGEINLTKVMTNTKKSKKIKN